MTRLTYCSIFITALLLAMNPQVGSAEVSVSPIGLQVVHNQFDKEQYDFDPFNNASGTVIQLLVTSPEKSIVALDVRESAVTRLTDDSGADLLQPAKQAQDAQSKFQSPAGFDHFPKISKDAHQAVVTVHGKRSPSPNTTKVQLAGHLLVQIAQGVRNVQVKNHKLEAGDLGLDGLQISIGSVGTAKTWDGKERQSVTFNLTGKTAADLKEIQFSDANGQPIDANRSSWMTMAGRKQIEYHLPPQTPQATLQIHLWKGLENVTVPLDLSIGLGL